MPRLQFSHFSFVLVSGQLLHSIDRNWSIRYLPYMDIGNRTVSDALMPLLALNF